MGNVYHRIGQLTTEKADANYMAAIAVPKAKALVLTATYGGQVRQGYQILTDIGNSKVAAAAVMPLLISSVKEGLEFEMISLEDAVRQARDARDSLKPDFTELIAAGSSQATRAKPFADYAAQNGASLYRISSRISQEEDLTKADINALVGAVYDMLRKEKGATARLKEEIRDYIRTRKVDEQVLKLLSEMMPQFSRPPEYDTLTARIASLNSKIQETASTLKRLESGQASNDEAGLAALTHALFAMKQGQVVPEEVEIVGVRIQVEQEIQKILGARYGSHFLAKVAETLAGGSNKKALAPYELADAINGPDDVQAPYLQPQRLAHMASALIRTLDTIVVAYFISDEQQSYKAADVRSSLLLSALLPENPAIRKLYPPEAVAVQGQPELSKQISERTAEAFKTGLMAGLAAKKLGMDGMLNKRSLDALVSLLDNLMPVVPMPIYELGGIGRMLPVLGPQIEKLDAELSSLHEQLTQIEESLSKASGAMSEPQRKQYKTGFEKYNPLAMKQRRLVDRYNSMITRAEKIPEELQARFGVDIEATASWNDSIVAEAAAEIVKLFGGEFAFVKPVIERRKDLELKLQGANAEIGQANDKQAVTL
ncbi:hypothetical protein HYU40_04800 [Candidatus Woesearchaeota archaeon]|nr:hypothetical protein [Candidatus Woesearchaeota archaeon]